jgi:hypothetical protein
MAPSRAERRDYAPTLRPRTARQDGLRRFTPGYLDDLSDTKFRYVVADTTADAQTILVPSPGKKLRLILLKIFQLTSDGARWVEVYFGNGSNIGSAPAKAIDIVHVPDASQGATRTWSRGTGPVGASSDVLTLRWTTAPTTSHIIIAEYTEER